MNKLIENFFFDQFLSEALKKKCYRVRSYSGLHGIEPDDAEFLFFKSAIHLNDELNPIRDLGYCLICSEAHYRFPATELVDNNSFSVQFVRRARKEDRSSLLKIAGSSFIFDRFHQDPNISQKLADELKVKWVENCLNGLRGNAVKVFDSGSGVSGFVCLAQTPSSVLIDLIAVMPGQHRRGIGKALIQASLAFAKEKKLSLIVGTQLENVASTQLYENSGFKKFTTQAVWHKHK